MLHPTQHEAMADQRVRALPPTLPGWHQRHFCSNTITLSLFLGEAAHFLNDLTARHPHGVDAWFLDGFAPSKNPDMWSDTILNHMGPLSRAGASVATFTSVGRVRRGLAAQGFEMRRVDQLPHKHESLAGRLAPGLGRAPTPKPRQMQVLGAGIAGCSIAAHFADQGVDVQLVDTATTIASGASSVVALQHARLLGDGSPQAEWRAAAYHYATHWTRGRGGVRPIGAVQGVGPNLNEAKLSRIAARYADTGTWLQHLTAVDAAELANREFASPALYFPDAATVDLPKLCTDLANHDRIELRLGTTAAPDLPTVYACGSRTNDIPAFETLDIKALWGQIDLVQTTTAPQLAMLGDGYVAPFEGGAVIGSTYEYAPWEEQAATQHNLARAPLSSTWRARRRGARAVAPDRTPIVGSYHGNWLSAAHGSMGATSAHLAAAVLVSQYLGYVPPISAAVQGIVDPHRFERRAQKKAARRR